MILGHLIDAESAVRLFRTGSSGCAYIRKARIGGPREFERVIVTVADGGSVTNPDVVAALNAIYAKLDLPHESVVCRRVRAAQHFMAAPTHTRETTAPPLATRV